MVEQGMMGRDGEGRYAKRTCNQSAISQTGQGKPSFTTSATQLGIEGLRFILGKRVQVVWIQNLDFGVPIVLGMASRGHRLLTNSLLCCS